MVTHLLMDAKQANRVAGAVGFNVRNGNFYVFRAKAVIVAAGGASHIFKPRAVGEGMGRTWYAPWSSASAYALPILAGAKMTQMENRIVLTRFKDGYGPVGAYFLHLKTYTENAYGENYEPTWYEHTRQLVGDYVDRHPVPTCLRTRGIPVGIQSYDDRRATLWRRRPHRRHRPQVLVGILYGRSDRREGCGQIRE